MKQDSNDRGAPVALRQVRRRPACSCSSFSASLCLMALIVLSAALEACIVRSGSSVVGNYVLSTARERITLTISADGTFAETIMLASGQVDKRTGRWEWSAGRLSFDELSIPKSFAPDYLRPTKPNGSPKYPEPGYWSISPENHWGTIVLPIFPNEDVNFKMVKRSDG